MSIVCLLFVSVLILSDGAIIHCCDLLVSIIYSAKFTLALGHEYTNSCTRFTQRDNVTTYLIHHVLCSHTQCLHVASLERSIVPCSFEETPINAPLKFSFRRIFFRQW